MKNLLPKGTYVITGGAGYIGSFFVKKLLETQKNIEIIIIDNLSKSNKKTIKKLINLKSKNKVKFIKADIGHPEKYKVFLKNKKIKAAIHFAGFIDVKESFLKPKKYLINNVNKAEKFLNTLIKNNCLNFIFSSSCSVYGKSKFSPITEKHPTNPISPYGQSKLLFEKVLNQYRKKYGLNFISFRYFNAAGADKSAEFGENHHPENHLIPNVLSAVIKNKSVKIFGNNYDTPDGTCIRDYIHVEDLIDAHLKGLKLLLEKKLQGANIFNLGTGKGFSILDIIKNAEKVTHRKVKIKFEKRRPGDVPELVASNNLARKILGWGKNLKSIEEIIKSAWKWHIKQSKKKLEFL